MLQKLANAFFTDPEDQSAWIYTEWLIAMDPYSMAILPYVWPLYFLLLFAAIILMHRFAFHNACFRVFNGS